MDALELNNKQNITFMNNNAYNTFQLFDKVKLMSFHYKFFSGAARTSLAHLIFMTVGTK